MDYQILKSLHILSAILLFGTGLGSAFYKYFADRSGKWVQQKTNRTIQADTLHQAGCQDNTQALFLSAETLQARAILDRPCRASRRARCQRSREPRSAESQTTKLLARGAAARWQG